MFIDTKNSENTQISQNLGNNYIQELNHNKASNHNESNNFQSVLEEENKNYVQKDTRTNKEIIEDMKKLVEDIISKIKTGMTKEEIEALEEALRKINEEMKKENYDKQEVEEMIQELERAIAYYKKKITGEFISKSPDKMMQTLELAIASYGNSSSPKEGNNVINSKETKSFNEDINNRLEKASENISELRNGSKKIIPQQVHNETEVLELIKKFQQK